MYQIQMYNNDLFMDQRAVNHHNSSSWDNFWIVWAQVAKEILVAKNCDKSKWVLRFLCQKHFSMVPLLHQI